MRPLVSGLLLVALGGVIVALPDTGDRLFSLSEEHGPSPLDAAGLTVLLAGYALLVALVWRHRSRLSGAEVLRALVAVAVGGALLAAAIALDLGALWAVAVAVMALPQLDLLVRAVARESTDRRRAARSPRGSG